MAWNLNSGRSYLIIAVSIDFLCKFRFLKIFERKYICMKKERNVDQGISGVFNARIKVRKFLKENIVARTL